MKNSNIEEIIRIAKELSRRDLEELIRELGGEKVVEILGNNIKTLEMQVTILKLQKKEKEKRQRKIREIRRREEEKRWEEEKKGMRREKNRRE